jgi:hypothetical protein
MSDTTQTHDSSNESETIVVAPSGITRRPRYVKNMNALAERAIMAVRRMAVSSMDNVVAVVKNSYELYEAVDDLNPEFEVQSYTMDFRRLLDDTAFHQDGERLVRGVAQDTGPIAEIASGDIPADEFDLNNRDHRGAINWDAVPNGRILRAREKARRKCSERLVNTDYFDDEPNADHAVVLHDGTDRKEDERDTFFGVNRYVKYPSELDGDVLSVNCNRNDDSILNYTLFLLESNNSDLTVDDLSDEQIDSLRESEDKDTLERHGISDETTKETVEPIVAD